MSEIRPLLTVKDVARLTTYSEDTVLRAVSRGELTALKFRKAFRFRPADLEVYLQSLVHQPLARRPTAKTSSAKRRRLRAIAGGRT